MLRGNNISTQPIAPSRSGARHPASAASGTLFGLIFLSAALGVGYWFLLERTRFGFDLKASGESPTAAAAGGVNARRMVIIALLLSGAVAGLVGLPELLGRDLAYTLNSPTGYGFTGIAIALLGRNHPVGMALGALLWAFLDKSALALDNVGVPREIVLIMQGSIVLSVVVAYEIVRRYELAAEQRRVAAQLRARAAEPAGVGSPGPDRREPVVDGGGRSGRRRPGRGRGGACPAGRVRRSSWRSGSLILSITVSLTGQVQLTSSGTAQAAVRLLLPILLAGLGGLWSERAGVVNIGLEGMMILGTWGAGWAGYQWGPWAALLGGIVFGALGGLLHAVATVTFGVDHIVSGVAINCSAWASRSTWRRWCSCRSPARRRAQSPRGRAVRRVLDARCCPTARPRSRTSSGWFVSDLAGPARRARHEPVPAGRDRVRARPAQLLRALAHPVRAAAALLRREPGGRRVARRERLPATSTSAW